MITINIVIAKNHDVSSKYITKNNDGDHVIGHVTNYLDLVYFIHRSVETGKNLVWIQLSNYPYDLTQKTRLLYSVLRMIKQEIDSKINIILLEADINDIFNHVLELDE